MKVQAGTKEIITPAQYQTITKQVVATPASTREIVIPAEYIIFTKQIVVTPTAGNDANAMFASSTAIAAQYETIIREVVDQPAHVTEKEIPAEYKTITRTILAKSASSRETVIPA